jgi:CheY-like chemotaxis protein
MAAILIVDDETFVRDILKRWLQATGHTIYEADSADAALQVLDKAPVGVVVSDIQMPGHNAL